MKCLEQFYSNTEKSVIYRIDKRAAKKLFNLGYTVYLTPSKARFDSVWVTPHSVSNKTTVDFDLTICYFKQYNCNSQLGYDVRYFVKASDGVILNSIK